MTFRVLDPTAGEAPATGQLAPRLDTLAGKTVGFISNGKEGTKGFFTHLEKMLREELRRRQGGEPHQVELQRARPTPISSPRSGNGMPSSPALGIEAAAHRAVCTTPSLPREKGSPPSGS